MAKTNNLAILEGGGGGGGGGPPVHPLNTPMLNIGQFLQQRSSGLWQDKMVISTFSYVQKQCFEI